MRLVQLTSRFTGDPFLICGISLGITTSKCEITKVMAERVGFEPTLPFRVNTLSKRAPSATRPSLRRNWVRGFVLTLQLIQNYCSGVISFYWQELMSANRDGNGSSRHPHAMLPAQHSEQKSLRLANLNTQEIFGGVMGSFMSMSVVDEAVTVSELPAPAAAPVAKTLTESPFVAAGVGIGGGFIPSTT